MWQASEERNFGGCTGRVPCLEHLLAIGHAIRPDFYLPELDVYIEYWGMDTADYKIGMLKKQQLYQQQGKRLISIHPADKPRLDTLLRTKLAFFGYTVPAPGEPGVGERQ